MKYTRLTANATLLGNLITLIVSVFYFYYTNSSALLYSVFISLSGIVCSVLTILVIRQKAKGKNSKFSYGTNRLENFNALLISLIMFISVLIAVESAIYTIINDEHILKNFITIPVTLLVAFSTQLTILMIANKGLKFDNSPILVILFKDAKVGTIRNFVSFILVVILWLLSIHNEYHHFWIDKLLAFSFGAYGTYIYLSQIYSNFKSLSDYPLDEKEQLFILNILTKHFSEFQNIRKIYTTTKGNDFLVEVEIMFSSETPVNEVIKLQKNMESDFKEEYKTGQFKLILIEDKI
jgi:divalent metal cation (Fe/Co/Zn/Cd) transporter